MCKTVSKNAVSLMPVYIRCNVSFVRLNPVRWFEFSGMHLCRWFQLCPSSNIPIFCSPDQCVKLGLFLALCFFFILSVFPLLLLSGLSVCLVSAFSLILGLEIGLESHLIVNERVWCLYMRGCNRKSNLVQWALPFSCLSSSGCNPNYLGEPL